LQALLVEGNPMIWRHFLVGCNRTIADLHFPRQIAIDGLMAISPGFFHSPTVGASKSVLKS
jgi:hypothetical protein